MSKKKEKKIKIKSEGKEICSVASIADAYLHIHNGGVSIAVVDENKGATIIFSTNHDECSKMTFKVSIHPDALYDLGTMLIKAANAHKFSNPSSEDAISCDEISINGEPLVPIIYGERGEGVIQSSEGKIQKEQRKEIA